MGRYFADIRNEDGIIEIQTRALYRLKPKLDAFLPLDAVTVVYPIAAVKRLSWLDPKTRRNGCILPRTNHRSHIKLRKAGFVCMADSRIYEDWLAKARTDLESARILFEHGGDYATVAFHCQQAIEKGLKGFILKSSKQLKDGHSLIYLCRKASAYNDDFEPYFKDCAYVNQFYIESRYPPIFARGR